jgi:membrane-associated protein
MDFFHWLEPEAIIRSLGVLGVFAIIFAESGLFFGFIFPGDSLLFTAGLLAPAFGINIVFLTVGVTIMAILGDSVGYYFGKKVGPRIFAKEDSFFFSKKHLCRSEEFFAKHGPKALILARFIPAVRTFTPILAGVGSMNYKTFLTYNVMGGILWGTGITLLGYFLGRTIPNVDQFLFPIIAGIIAISFVPLIVEGIRYKLAHRRI